jgi:ankyrin repeat protein
MRCSVTEQRTMDDKILQLLDGREELYPHALEQGYPRILAKILELWNTPEADAYFNDLLIDERGDRQGFPLHVASEIIHLSLIHARQTVPPPPQNDLWESDAPISKSAIELNDHQLTRNKSLLDAAESGDVELTHHLLQTSRDELDSTDARHWTPLIVAAFNGHDLVTRMLLEAGANTAAQDKSGYTALHWAAYNGQTRIVKLLLDGQAAIDARSQSGWTPLMQAAARGHLGVAILLVDRGAEVNASSQDGATALLKAAANGHLDVVKLLLDHHATASAKLKDGSTALSLANKNGHHDIAAMLQSLS